MIQDDDAGAAPVPPAGPTDEAVPRDLTPAARRALAEAEARRRAEKPAGPAPAEEGGRGGLDPVRYADWEIAGRAVDF